MKSVFASYQLCSTGVTIVYNLEPLPIWFQVIREIQILYEVYLVFVQPFTIRTVTDRRTVLKPTVIRTSRYVLIYLSRPFH